MAARRRPIRLVGLALVISSTTFVAFDAGSAPAAAAATVISFEEGVPSPGNVTSQYCNNVTTNMGVRFLDAVRLIEPAVGTMTPTHAATNHFPGDEFSEFDVMRIGFTADQSFVSVRVGLDRAYARPITAELRVYTTPVPQDSSELTAERDSVLLGTGPTIVNHQLYATSPGSALPIRSLEIEFTGATEDYAAHEVIDNLLYPTIGPPCIVDTADPTVEILEPTPGTPFYGSPSGGEVPVALHLRAADPGTGVASVGVEFLGSGATTLEEFWVCGGANAPACALPSSTVERSFSSWMPESTTAIRVTAQDFAGNSASAVRLVAVTTSSANVWSRGLEITQAIQPWIAEAAASRRNAGLGPPTFAYPAAPTAVPLVAGRTTVVRLFVGAEGTIAGGVLPGVGGTLRCFTEPSYTVPCPGPSLIYPEHQPPQTTKTIAVDPADSLTEQRRDSGLTLNFVLPDAWTTAGVVSLEARVTPPVPECAGCADAANAIRVHSIWFRNVPSWHTMVRQVLVDRIPAGGMATGPEREAVLRHIRRVYPIDESTVMNGWQLMPYIFLSLPGQGPDCSEFLEDLHSTFEYLLDDYGYEVVWAFADSQQPSWCSGLGSAAGVAVSRGDRWDSGAHEIGHAVGLKHSGPPPGFGAECSKSGYCDSDWPWPLGGIGAFGYDVLSFTVHDPGPVDAPLEHDIMSYGNPVWISARTWIRIFNALTDASQPYPQASTAVTEMALDGAPASPTPHLLVRGRYDAAAGQWELLPVYEIDRIPRAAEAETPDLLVELTDAAGTVLASTPIALPEDEHIDTDDPDVVEVPDPSFMRYIEVPAGIERVVLRAGSTVLATRSRSDSAPVAAIVEPTAAGFDGSIRWTWSDGDGDPLRALVWYRHAADAPWQPLAIDLAADTLTVDPALLPGGPGAQVRVAVTDGFTTTIATSDTFQKPDTPPTVEILRPAGDDRFETGRRVVLRGNGADREDQVLEGADLEWSSDIDGALGTGGTLEVASLSPGTHTITLRGSDSARNTASATVVVHVDPAPTMNSQPIAAAGPDQGWTASGVAMLDGTGSTDPDGDPLSYHWRIVSAPAGAIAFLDDVESPTPTLHTGTSGTYEIELVVHDGMVGSRPDIVAVRQDVVAPTTSVVLDPPGPNGHDGWYVSPVTVTLIGADDAGGSGLATTEYRLDGGDWMDYSAPVVIDQDGARTLEARSVDVAGNVEEPPVRVTLSLDQTAPAPTVVVPGSGTALQDGVVLTATSADATSGTTALWFTIRVDDGGSGTPIGLEHLDATFDGASWVYRLDTTLVPDGLYRIRATAADAAGNEGTSATVAFSVRNWAVVEHLPSTPSSKAGRTVPVKFSIHVAAVVDPAMPFVHNEELTVAIVETTKPTVPLQEATFGIGARDYRISDTERLYITNFRTLRRPTEYTVTIRRGGLEIGSFTFSTER